MGPCAVRRRSTAPTTPPSLYATLALPLDDTVELSVERRDVACGDDDSHGDALRDAAADDVSLDCTLNDAL
jgi:hypothetical protein